MDNPDEIVYLKLDRSLYFGDFTVIGFENRQVVQIITSRHVTEYRAEVMMDSTGQKITADFPLGVSRPVQYGSEHPGDVVLRINHKDVVDVQSYLATVRTMPVGKPIELVINRQNNQMILAITLEPAP